MTKLRTSVEVVRTLKQGLVSRGEYEIGKTGGLVEVFGIGDFRVLPPKLLLVGWRNEPNERY